MNNLKIESSLVSSAGDGSEIHENYYASNHVKSVFELFQLTVV